MARRRAATVAAVLVLMGLAGCGGGTDAGASSTASKPAASAGTTTAAPGSTKASPSTSAPTTGVATSRPATKPVACATAWGITPRQLGSLNQPGGQIQAPLVATRVGRDHCWDTVVFEFDGSAKGYQVRYATELRSENKGDKLKVGGKALLWVHLLEPAYAGGKTTYPHTEGEHVARVDGFVSLKDVVYAGTGEGQATFGLGVSGELPFRVLRLAGPGSHSRIVVQVAHP